MIMTTLKQQSGERFYSDHSKEKAIDPDPYYLLYLFIMVIF